MHLPVTILVAALDREVLFNKLQMYKQTKTRHYHSMMQCASSITTARAFL